MEGFSEKLILKLSSDNLNTPQGLVSIEVLKSSKFWLR